jgi:hypothetical protein
MKIKFNLTSNHRSCQQDNIVYVNCYYIRDINEYNEYLNDYVQTTDDTSHLFGYMFTTYFSCNECISDALSDSNYPLYKEMIRNKQSYLNKVFNLMLHYQVYNVYDNFTVSSDFITITSEWYSIPKKDKEVMTYLYHNKPIPTKWCSFCLYHSDIAEYENNTYSKITLKKCKNCHIRYCSEQCQKEDWDVAHKYICSDIPPLISI